VLPFLGPEGLSSFGPWAILVVCLIVFAETGLLIGFILPGDTLLVITGLLTFTGTMTDQARGIHLPIWIVCLLIGFSAFAGGELGYLIGHKLGPRIFERKESGLFSKANVTRTNAFFERFGPAAVIIARFVPVVRTFAPIAAGVGHMSYRKYSLYNLIGALAWGAGVTLIGFFLGYIPPVARFVVHYIDYILLGAVALGVIPTAFHFIHGAIKARTANAEAEAQSNSEPDDLALDSSLFDQNKSSDR
jgi:membrane-associated protein